MNGIYQLIVKDVFKSFGFLELILVIWSNLPLPREKGGMRQSKA